MTSDSDGWKWSTLPSQRPHFKQQIEANIRKVVVNAMRQRWANFFPCQDKPGWAGCLVFLGREPRCPKYASASWKEKNGYQVQGLWGSTRGCFFFLFCSCMREKKKHNGGSKSIIMFCSRPLETRWEGERERAVITVGCGGVDGTKKKMVPGVTKQILCNCLTAEFVHLCLIWPRAATRGHPPRCRPTHYGLLIYLPVKDAFQYVK